MLRARRFVILIAVLLPLNPPGLPDDAQELRAIVEQHFAAAAKKDLSGSMSLWSSKSPEFGSRKQTLQRVFGSEDAYFTNLTISHVKVEGDKASLRADIDFSVSNLQSKQTRNERMARIFMFVKEDGTWRVWRYYSVGEELAGRLMAEKTEEEGKALLATEKDSITVELVRALMQQAQKDYTGGQNAQALRALGYARVIARDLGDKAAEKDALHRTGHVHDREGRYEAALASWREWLKLSQDTLDKRGAFDALHDLGHLYLDQGNFAQAWDCFQKSLKEAEAADNKADIAHMQLDSGRLQAAQGNYSEALNIFQKSLATAEASEDKARISGSLDGLAHFQIQQGNYSQGVELFQKRLAISEASGSKPEIAHALNDLANAEQVQGNYSHALEYSRKALTQMEALGNKAGVAVTLNVISRIYHDQGDYAQALGLAQEVLTHFETLGDKRNIASTLGRIADLHNHQGNYSQALELYQKILTMSEALGDKARIRFALGGFGFTYEKQGNYAQAMEFFQKSLALAEASGQREGIARALRSVAHVHDHQKNYPQALELFQKSMTIVEALGDKAGMVDILSHIGQVFEHQGNHSQAMESFQKSLSMAERLGNRDMLFRCNTDIGNVEKALGKKSEAIVAYQKALAYLEAIRSQVAGGDEEKQTFVHMQGGDEIYKSLVSLLAEQGNTAEALSTLERAKSKQLLDALRLRSLTVPDPNLRALLAKTEQLEQALAAQEQARLAEISKPDHPNHARIANLTELVAHTREELFKVTNSIREANPDYERFITIKATDLRSIQRKLPPNVVVVEYLPLEPALIIFLVTQKGTQAHSVAVSRQRIEELVGALHAEVRVAQKQGGENLRGWSWQSDRARPLRGILTALYGYLIAPIQNELVEAETVVIVPSGVLYYLPFQALAREQSDRSLTFLVEQKQLAVLTSLQLWEQISGEAPSGRSASRQERLGAFANPDGTLPAAEQEVKRIASIFGQSLVFLGDKVTRTQLVNLPKDVTLIHFATRGRLDEGDINECYLMLAKGEKLKLGEIYGLAGKYTARMTVLSACETELRRKDPGNEVAHLANGFVQAGSTTIIASLWQVSDVSTAVMMERFYRELKTGKSTAEAKRAAEISLLKNKETAHPYFWAPFVLIGDWR